MKDQLTELASDIESLSNRLGDLIFDALRTQSRGGDDAASAKEFERQLARARRSLVKAEQVLRDLASE